MTFYFRTKLCFFILLLINNISVAKNLITKKKEQKLIYLVSIDNFNNNTSHLLNIVSEDDAKNGSMLSWKVNNALILNNNLQIKITPKTSINLNGYIGITRGNGILKDYDAIHNPIELLFILLDENGLDNNNDINRILETETNSDEWNMVSYNKTKLKSLKGFDLNMQQKLFTKNNLSIDVLLGYKIDDYHWKTYNINQYMFNEFEFHGKTNGIEYKELYKTPYIGLHFNYNYYKWNFDLTTKYSHWAKYKATDSHVLRNLNFNIKNKNYIDYYGINFKISYALKSNLDTFINYGWNKYSRFSIMQKVYENDKLVESFDESKNIYDKFWIKNISQSFAIGLKFKF